MTGKELPSSMSNVCAQEFAQGGNDTVLHIKERKWGLSKLGIQGQVPFGSTGQENTFHSDQTLYFLKTMQWQCLLK